VFTLGSLVKCTSLYFASVNCDLCCSAYFLRDPINSLKGLVVPLCC
jgi:hypothetical protein